MLKPKGMSSDVKIASTLSWNSMAEFSCMTSNCTLKTLLMNLLFPTPELPMQMSEGAQYLYLG